MGGTENTNMQVSYILFLIRCYFTCVTLLFIIRHNLLTQIFHHSFFKFQSFLDVMAGIGNVGSTVNDVMKNTPLVPTRLSVPLDFLKRLF